MDKLSLRLRLFLVMALPIAGLLYFSAAEVLSRLKTEREIGAMRQLTDLAVAASAVVHELQKERGMSAGFIGSKGERFRNELTTQRADSDARIGAFKRLGANVDATRHGEAFKGALDDVARRLAGIDEVRRNVSALALTPPQSFEYYTGAIGSILETISYVVKLSTHERIAKTTTGYLMFISAKEQAGRERATANTAFAADKMDAAAFRRYIGIVSVQDAYLAAFRTYADPALIAFQKETLAGPFAPEIERMRKVLIDRGEQGGFEIDPKQWFTAATARIDAMKGVEDRATAGLQALMDELGSAARRALLLAALLSAAVIGAALWLGLSLIRGLWRQLGGEPGAVSAVAHRIAEGDLGGVVEIENGDTTSVLASMKLMQDTLSRLVGEIQTVVDAAVKGDFERRIDLAGKRGFGRAIGESLNQLSETTSVGLNDVMRVSGALSCGDLSQKITQDYPGIFGEMRSGVNRTVEAMSGLVAEIRVLADAAARGDFSKRIEVTDKQGFGRDIGTLLNTLSDTTDVGLRDVMRVAGALAAGDLSQKITEDYPGVFGETKAGVNNIVDTLSTLVEDIHAQADAAARGDFSRRIDLSTKRGFGRDISNTMNALVNTTETGLQDIMRVAQALAAGDLTQTIAREYPGLFGQTRDGINGTVANLKQLVTEIKDAVTQIDSAAREISLGNQDLSSRTEEQASSLEETAASMQDLAQTMQDNEARVEEANTIAASATELAGRGGAIVRESVTTMARIAESSRRIVDIVAVIDSIAFQTNILALNAAVEAARAGEQGRGFAVVASEVRSLAQRSAEAARDIHRLIQESVDKVEAGATQVNRAGTAMEETIAGIEGMTAIMAEISSASRTQTTGAEQVSRAVQEMDKVTQQNAALVEEAAAAAEALQDQADNLMRAVETFKLEDSGQFGGDESAAVDFEAPDEGSGELRVRQAG